ncbi:MAG: hypothetical protein DMF37_05770 [Verrucomicrobia bacterium]|nr:MAG: hypothetical protein DMF37_05770 [Verrucomicrobiota bacterium]
MDSQIPSEVRGSLHDEATASVAIPRKRAVSLAKMTDLFSRAGRTNTTPNSRRKTSGKSAIYFRFPVPTFTFLAQAR